jgi:drug/metabolite transporter (DMT)-like permease
MVGAYRSGDLSLVYPLMRGVAPLLTGAIAVFWMREWPGVLAWAGMVLISLGVFALAHRPARLGPALHGHSRAVGFALANAVVMAVYTIIDGSGARVAGNAWS